MRIIKSFVMAAVFLLALESSSSAVTAVMSLQEMMRQSDAVIIGTIEESHRTDVTDANMGRQLPQLNEEHWLATCRVERYIIGPKIDNPDLEEAKSASIIHIAFTYRIQLPARIKLMGGRKYLLFLKETGPNEYEMITPYHGAFEAGQTYYVYDDESPGGKMSFEEIVQRVTRKNPASVDIRQQPERELSEDELRIKERLIALSRGEGDVVDLRIELMDGGMLKHRSDTIANGKIVSRVWDLAAPPKGEERTVTDEEIRRLLQTLIEHQYWTFKGTKFIPDANGFMFRFHYKDLPPIEYRCDAHEYEPSAQLSAIRSVWLSFVSGASPQDQASCESQGGRWGRFGLMEKDQCNRPTTDAGKECSDHSECESDCVTEDSVLAGTAIEGKCFGWTVTLGTCMNLVKDGKAQGVVCVD